MASAFEEKHVKSKKRVFFTPSEYNNLLVKVLVPLCTPKPNQTNTFYKDTWISKGEGNTNSSITGKFYQKNMQK